MADALLSDDDMGVKSPLMSDEDMGVTKPKQMSDAEMGVPGKDRGFLSNSPDDSDTTKFLKGTATAAIKGAADIPGVFGGIRDFGRYAADRAVAGVRTYAFGKPTTVEDVEAARKKYDDADRLSNAWMPNGETFSAPILKRTGEYVPEDSLGRTGMALVEGAVGGLGMGSGVVKAGAKAGPAILETVKMAPMNAVQAGAGQAVTEATGDPLLGAAAGAASGPVVHGSVELAKPFARPIWGSVSEGSRKTQAGERLMEYADDPQAFRKAIESDAAMRQGLPESPKTAGQITGDKGILQAERTFTDADEGFERRMRGVAERQNEERLKSMDSVASETARPSAIVDAIEARHNAITQRYADLEAKMLEKARAEMEKLGPNADPVSIGAQLREAMLTARAKQKAEIDALYKQVDPDGDMRLIVTDVRDAANNILKNKDPLDKFTPDTNELLEAASGLPEVTRFKSLRALDRRLSDAQSTERRANGESVSLGHLSRLKGAVKDAINKAIENQAAWEEAAGIPKEQRLEGRLGQVNIGDTASGNPATDIGAGVRQKAVGDAGAEVGVRPSGGETRPADGGLGNARVGAGLDEKAGPEGRVFYPGGNVDVRYEVVDLGDINASHGPDFSKNPAYPQEIQPRNRSSKPAQDQVLTMAKDFTPERMGRSAEANTGAPIIGPDGAVESGNGRTIATMINYEKGDPAGYRKWLEGQGYDTTGMKRPILVGRRTTKLSPDQRIFFAESANGPAGLKLGKTEQSSVDAKAMTPDVISKLVPGGINAEANKDFVFAFLNKLSANDRGDMIDPKTRSLTKDGLSRLEAAVMQTAYGDGELVSRGFQSTDNNIKNITGAMSEAAGAWAKMRAAASDGLISGDHDITRPLINIVKDIMRARDNGRPVAEVLNQISLLDIDVDQSVRALMLNGDKVASKAQIAARLTKYAEEAVKNVGGDALFPSEVTPKKILETATGAKFEETPEAPTSASGAGEKMPVDPESTPNIKPGQAEALNKANKRYGEYAETYKKGAVGSSLKSSGFSGNYQVIDSAVAGKAIRPGDVGYEVAKKFITAANKSPEAISAMKEQVLNKFRSATTDGVASGSKFTTALRSYAGAIRAIEEVSPGFMKSIETPAKAAVEFEQAAARAKLGRTALKNEQAAKFLGVKSDLDIQNKIGSMIGGSGASVDKVRNFMSQLDPDVKESVQRAAIDWLFRNETNKDMQLSSAKLDRLIKHKAPVLAEVFTKEQMNTIRAIHRDLQLSDRTAKAASSTGSRSARDAKHNIREAVLNLADSGGRLAMLGVLYHAYETGGIHGLMTYGIPGFGYKILGDLRARGVGNINDLVKEAMLDPSFARELLKRVPAKNENEAYQSLRGITKALSRTANFLYRTTRATPKYPFEREKEMKREGRATGGRIGKAMTAEQIIAGIERCRKDEQKRTEVILDQPDESVVRALAAANQHI